MTDCSPRAAFIGTVFEIVSEAFPEDGLNLRTVLFDRLARTLDARQLGAMLAVLNEIEARHAEEAPHPQAAPGPYAF